MPDNGSVSNYKHAHHGRQLYPITLLSSTRVPKTSMLSNRENPSGALATTEERP
jgi:hypothetical protein